MSDYIIDQQDVFDDSDFLYEEYLKTKGGVNDLCKDCNYNKKDEGHDDCKFCARKGKFANSVINTETPLHKILDIADNKD